MGPFDQEGDLLRDFLSADRERDMQQPRLAPACCLSIGSIQTQKRYGRALFPLYSRTDVPVPRRLGFIVLIVRFAVSFTILAGIRRYPRCRPASRQLARQWCDVSWHKRPMC